MTRKLTLLAGVLVLGVSLQSQAQSSRPGLGSTLYQDGGDTGATFRVWAPNATSVVVRGDFNTWTETPLMYEGSGLWSADVTGAVTGQQYRYLINGTLSKRDPRSRRVSNSGSSGNSIIYSPAAFDWNNTPQPKPGRKDTVIYQMHVGTFAGSPTPRTFDHATNRLDYIKALGVNVVQLMPINEFAGGQSWGYNPADPFAIESSYGGPDAFKRFVRACHERSLAVFVDVVHNHYGPSDLALWRYDGWWLSNYGGIYFYNDTRANTPWGSTRPDFGRSQVRDYIRDQIMMYVTEYRVGGFRWDAPYYIINSDWGHNQSGEHMLRDINWELSQNYSYVQRIAEDNAFDYSMNFQGQWDVDGRWDLHNLVTTSADSGRDMYKARDVLRNWASLNRVLFSEAHDYVAANNGRNRLPSEIDSGNPESIWARKRSLLATSLVLTAPAIPMIFQGQEMLETQAFHDNVPLRWDRTNSFAGFVRAYTDMVHVRRNLRGGTAGLKGTGINVHHVDNNNKVLGFIRWDAGGQSDDVLVIANFANKNWTNNTYSIGFPSDGTWYRHFNGDATNYQSDFGNIGPTQVVVSGGAASVNMGRYSVQIFSKTAATGQPEAAVPPAVQTGPVTEITNTTARADGEVTDDGGAEVVERGVVWNTTGNPTTNNARSAAGSGIGSFTNSVTGLTIGQLYYLRAYARNSAGVGYGHEVSFEAGGLAAPGLAINPNQLVFTAMLGSTPPAQSITLTNQGIGLLLAQHEQIYGTGPGNWLVVPATNISLNTGGSTSLLVSIQGSAFTETGTFTATNRVSGNQTNGDVTVVVSLTITSIPPPATANAVADGAELVRLTVGDPAGRSILVVHHAQAPSEVDPANGIAYAVDSQLGNGRVIFKFMGSPGGTNLEHVVKAGSRNFYTFYAISQDRYSSSVVVGVTAAMYRVGAWVETFAYTNTGPFANSSGGQGWTNAWTVSIPRTNTDVAVDAGNFTNFPPEWPHESGHRILLKTTNTSLYAAFRKFSAVTSGTLYVSALYQRQNNESNSDGKFSGISFYDGAAERAFVGERGNIGNDDLFGVTVTGQGNNTVGAADSFPAAREFLLVGRYDFNSHIMAGVYFTNRVSIPASEPAFLVTTTGSISRIDGLRLAAGATTGWNGNVVFDELKIATSWSNLLQIALLENEDSDQDSIPDGWTQWHFGQPTGSVETLSMADQDADEDGQNNLDEYIASTYPLDPNSWFHIEQADSEFLSFWSATGRWYDVEALAELEAWHTVISNQPGQNAVLVLPAGHEPPWRWYRARVRLAP